MLIFVEKFDFWRKFGFLAKIWIFGENLAFGENLDFRRKFGFLMKKLIFGENFDFWRKFRFLTKKNIFGQNFENARDNFRAPDNEIRTVKFSENFRSGPYYFYKVRSGGGDHEGGGDGRLDVHHHQGC